MAGPELKKVDKSLTCTICHDMYADPCTLQCQHTFCRKCITKYTKTKPAALQSKTIPCPSCPHITEVPDPTRPVDEWAWQIKPFIDSSQPDATTTGDADHCCNACERQGETTPATSSCLKCRMALCDRCRKTHHASPTSRDHDICNGSNEVKIRRHKVLCGEHKGNSVEFHCKDCKKSACQKCCIIYHRACKPVLNIESMRTDLLKRRDAMFKQLNSKSMKITPQKVDIKKISENRMKVRSQIQSASQKAIDKIKQKEKQLMEELDDVTEKQMSLLRDIEIQMYRQQFESINQAVNSDCAMDIYDMHQVCASGALVRGEKRSTNMVNRGQIKEIRFAEDSLDNLQLGRIEANEENSVDLSSPVLCDTIDAGTSPLDVTVLVVDGVQTVVVTDHYYSSLKSLYTRSNKACYSALSFKTYPRAVTQVNENQVMVTVPGSKQFVTVKVTPDLVRLKTVSTRRGYYALALINQSSLAAGSWYPDCVDILNMMGQVMKSISAHNDVRLFDTIWPMCVNKKGNILVSDCGKKMLTCLTSGGDVLWQHPLGDCTGITTNSNNDILLTFSFSQKVIQLTETGWFVREVLTSADDLCFPKGICMSRSGNLILCDDHQVKEFKLG